MVSPPLKRGGARRAEGLGNHPGFRHPSLRRRGHAIEITTTTFIYQ